MNPDPRRSADNYRRDFENRSKGNLNQLAIAAVILGIFVVILAIIRLV